MTPREDIITKVFIRRDCQTAKELPARLVMKQRQPGVHGEPGCQNQTQTRDKEKKEEVKIIKLFSKSYNKCISHLLQCFCCFKSVKHNTSN